MLEASLQCQVGDCTPVFRITSSFLITKERFSVEYFVEYALHFKFVLRVFEEFYENEMRENIRRADRAELDNWLLAGFCSNLTESVVASGQSYKI